MKKFLFIALAASISLVACKDDDPDEPMIENEEELITTLTYTLTPANGMGDTVRLVFRDLDGDGSNPAVITTDSIEANTVYNGSIELLNETETPAEDITEEIRDEDEEHQFFYELSDASYSLTYTDMDSLGNPIGLTTRMETHTGSTDLKITLRHEPSKGAANVSSGDITNAGGETDIEVTFNLNVK